MSDLNFDRAEYLAPQTIQGEVVGRPQTLPMEGPYHLALLYGTGAAIIGALGYALVGLSHFMISIVAIGMAWIIAKAMMTASNGIGGRRYQIAALVLTYLSVTLGQTLDLVWYLHADQAPYGVIFSRGMPILLKTLLAGPFLRGISGVIGLLIIGIGMRYAWRMTSGEPGSRGPLA